MTVVEPGPVLRAAGDGDLESLGRHLERDRACASVLGTNPYWGGRVQPLHMAVTWNQEAAVELLLESGANPSGENEGYGDWSPLMLAATKGFDSIAARLEAAGAYVGLYEASALGRPREVADILDGNPERATHVTVDGTTPLHVAATREVADLLLAAGALPDVRDGYGGTPLDAAMARASQGADQCVEVAERLIAGGAEVDLITHAALGHPARLAAALDRDPSAIDAHTRSGCTPLQAAVAHGRVAIVRMLLERGANPNAADGEGIQPLHWVTRAPRHDLEIARLLLAAGANPSGRDARHDAPPSSWAEFQRRPDLERLLREAKGSSPT
ncbi:MAG: ankyrin repeat domain-containing protein [Gemmatimonadota bacterium]|nr:ankyrin repeat domain-containing protein [Gemmatimonadota bacterium]